MIVKLIIKKQIKTRPSFNPEAINLCLSVASVKQTYITNLTSMTQKTQLYLLAFTTLLNRKNFCDWYYL